MTVIEKNESWDLNKKSQKMNIILFVINVLFIIGANVINLTIVHLLILFLFSYIIFMIYSYKSLSNLRNLFLSAEVIFVSVFFIYAVPNAFIYVLDGYVPRITYFLINQITVFKTLLLYFNIYTVLILIIMLTGGVHTLKINESKLNNKTLVSFDLFDLVALVLTAYFYYLNFRNGFSIFGQFFQDLRQNILSSVHNLNNYMYLYMIVYCYINLYKIIYRDRKKQKFTYKEFFFLIIFVAFWSLSLLTDRRNLFTLILLLVFLFFNKLKKINFKKVFILVLCVVALMSMSYFRSGTNRRDINNVLFLSLGEFIFVNYVSEYYINNCSDDLYYGKTYLFDTMVSVIPRRFYPNKPETLSVKFWREAKTNVGYAFNPVAEGLINFGIKGSVLMVPFVILFFIKMAYRFSKKNFLYYFIICSESINFYRGTFSSTIFTLVVMLLLSKLMLLNYKRIE